MVVSHAGQGRIGVAPSGRSDGQFPNRPAISKHNTHMAFAAGVVVVLAAVAAGPGALALQDCNTPAGMTSMPPMFPGGSAGRGIPAGSSSSPPSTLQFSSVTFTPPRSSFQSSGTGGQLANGWSTGGGGNNAWANGNSNDDVNDDGSGDSSGDDGDSTSGDYAGGQTMSSSSSSGNRQVVPIAAQPVLLVQGIAQKRCDDDDDDNGDCNAGDCASRTTVKVKVIVDGTYKLYFNGIPQPHVDNNRLEAAQFNLKHKTGDVIGIEARSRKGLLTKAGILADITYVKGAYKGSVTATADAWICTRHKPQDNTWMTPTFKNYGWRRKLVPATKHAVRGQSSWGTKGDVETMAPDAEWFWTKHNRLSGKVWCRTVLK